MLIDTSIPTSKWEAVSSDVSRHPVPGGWIYYYGYGNAICFVPMPGSATALCRALEALIGHHDNGGTLDELDRHMANARAALQQAKGE